MVELDLIFDEARSMAAVRNHRRRHRSSLRLLVAFVSCAPLIPTGRPTDSPRLDHPVRATAPVVYHAYNEAHALEADFAEDGIRVRSLRRGDAGWEWELKLERFGYEGSLEPVEKAAPIDRGDRVEYRRAALTEWYVDAPRGLEQGFDVRAAPPRRGSSTDHRGPLVLVLRAQGLELLEEFPGESIVLVARGGNRVLRYHGLMAWDADGADLPARMSVTDRGIRIEVDDTGARYPLTIDPYIERAILRASDADSQDEFGTGVDTWGDTAVVGARNENGGAGHPFPGVGAAYVFERDRGGAGNWGQVTKLMAGQPAPGANLGDSVAGDGDTVIVGASGWGDPGCGITGCPMGAAYVFQRDHGGPDNWGEVKQLTASDPALQDYFGLSVGISGDTVVVGVPYDDDAGSASGSVYLFERGQGGADNWGEVKKLTAGDAAAGDFFGFRVSISGDIVVVGAPFDADAGSASGSAYVFERNRGGPDNWGEAKKLTASDAASPANFGWAVANAGDSAIVGAPIRSSAYVFQQDHGGVGNWGELKKLVVAGQTRGFGESVAMSGGGAIVGDGFYNNHGAAHVFEHDAGGANNWGAVQRLVPSDQWWDDRFGFSVGISADTAIAGAPMEDGGPANLLTNSGAAYVFARRTWAYVLDGYGGLHTAGPDAVPVTPPPPYFGFEAARDAEVSSNGIQVLDGSGGVHAAGGETALSPPPPNFGFYIAKDIELTATGGGYVLDGFGGVSAAGGAPVLSPATPYFGWDIARDLELGGGGYYVLDGLGGLHAGAGATAFAPAPPYFEFDIARDLELAAAGGGYVLDGYGGVHVLGGAPTLTPATPYFGWDVAADLELAPGGGHYVLDSHGGLHHGGGAGAITPAPPYFGFDIARDLEIR